MTVLATRTRAVAHTVRAIHATTKEALAVTATFKTDVPHHWRLTAAPGLVVVSHDPAGRVPSGPVVVTLTVPDPLHVLAAPAADVTLDAADKTHSFAAAPATVEVTLVRRSNGAPSTGATVTVKPSSGPSVPLAETPPGSGVYRAQRTWGTTFHPLDVRVGNASTRRVAYDPTSLVQRIRLVDPT